MYANGWCFCWHAVLTVVWEIYTCDTFYIKQLLHTAPAKSLLRYVVKRAFSKLKMEVLPQRHQGMGKRIRRLTKKWLQTQYFVPETHFQWFLRPQLKGAL